MIKLQFKREKILLSRITVKIIYNIIIKQICSNYIFQFHTVITINQ